MNWRKVICWLKDHSWLVIDGKRYCTACEYEPENDVDFCPECGADRLMLCIMASDGYQYLECMKCGHRFQDTGESSVTVGYSGDRHELEKPVVDQDGNPIKQETEK